MNPVTSSSATGSFMPDSPSSVRASRRRSRDPRSTAKIAALSVAATAEPTISPSRVERSKISAAAKPARSAVTIVPTEASEIAVPRTGLISPQPAVRPPSKRIRTSPIVPSVRVSSASVNSIPPNPSEPTSIPSARKSRRPGTRTRSATLAAASPAASSRPPTRIRSASVTSGGLVGHRDPRLDLVRRARGEVAPGRHDHAVHQPQRECQAERCGGEADLDASRLVEHREEPPREEARGARRPAGRRRPRPPARERRLVERRRRQVQAHAKRDEQEPSAVVLEAAREGELHQGRAGDEDDDGDDERERRDPAQGAVDRARELVGAGLAAGAQTRQVGEKACRHALEDEQRRPRQHQHVEDEAGLRGALEGAREKRPRVQQRLLAQHDHEDRRGEATAGGERHTPVARRRRGDRLFDGTPPERERDDDEAEAWRGEHADCDRRLARCDADRHRERERRAGGALTYEQPREEREPPPAGEVAAGVEACPEDDYRPEHHPVEISRAREEAVLERPPQGEHRDRAGGGDPELDRRRDTQGAADLDAARPPVGDRPREQLLDRAVEDRDRDEDRRPQDDDLAVAGAV